MFCCQLEIWQNFFIQWNCHTTFEVLLKADFDQNSAYLQNKFKYRETVLTYGVLRKSDSFQHFHLSSLEVPHWIWMTLYFSLRYIYPQKGNQESKWTHEKFEWNSFFHSIIPASFHNFNFKSLYATRSRSSSLTSEVVQIFGTSLCCESTYSTFCVPSNSRIIFPNILHNN